MENVATNNIKNILKWIYSNKIIKTATKYSQLIHFIQHAFTSFKDTLIIILKCETIHRNQLEGKEQIFGYLFRIYEGCMDFRGHICTWQSSFLLLFLSFLMIILPHRHCDDSVPSIYHRFPYTVIRTSSMTSISYFSCLSPLYSIWFIRTFPYLHLHLYK